MKNNQCQPIWFYDYISASEDSSLVWIHFWKDFLFYHRIRYMVYFRYAQKTKNRLIRFLCEYRLYRLCRKYGIEIKTQTRIGPGFVMIHPYNITISTFAELGSHVVMLKGSTVGVSSGKHAGAPKIGNYVYIGLNSTVVGGITVGDDVLIAPNTFINEDVPSHSIVIGNPCKIIPKDNATANYIHKKF